MIGILIPAGFWQAAENDRLAACAPQNYAALDGGMAPDRAENRGIGVQKLVSIRVHL